MRKIFNLIKHPLFSGSAIMIVGSNSVSAINYLYHLLIGRLLGPAGYGELASLISLIGLLGVIPTSISLVIIKYVSSAKSKEEVMNLISWLKARIIKAFFLFFITILIASQAISSFLHIDRKIYLILIVISVLFSLQSLFYRSILQGLLRFKEMVFSILVENITKLIISILLVYLGFYVGGAVLAFLIATIIGWYVTTFYLRYNLKKNPTLPQNIKSMIFFTIPVFIQSIFMTSLYSSDVILVKHFFPPHEAGIYASLSTLGKIIFFGAGPIGAVMFPLVSQRRSRGETYRKIFILSFLATGLLAASVLSLYWLAPQFAIKLLYGTAYLEAANLLVWFGIFITLFTLSVLLINYGLSIGRTKIVFFSPGAAIMQIMLIWFFHSSLQEVVTVSILVTALLLVCLFIYSICGKTITSRDEINFSNSPNI